MSKVLVYIFILGPWFWKGLNRKRIAIFWLVEEERLWINLEAEGFPAISNCSRGILFSNTWLLPMIREWLNPRRLDLLVDVRAVPRELRALVVILWRVTCRSWRDNGRERRKGWAIWKEIRVITNRVDWVGTSLLFLWFITESSKYWSFRESIPVALNPIPSVQLLLLLLSVTKRSVIFWMRSNFRKSERVKAWERV